MDVKKIDEAVVAVQDPSGVSPTLVYSLRGKNAQSLFSDVERQISSTKRLTLHEHSYHTNRHVHPLDILGFVKHYGGKIVSERTFQKKLREGGYYMVAKMQTIVPSLIPEIHRLVVSANGVEYYSVENKIDGTYAIIIKFKS